MADYLSGLSAAERAKLEADSLLGLPPFLAQAYARAQASGKKDVIDAYQRCILERHVRTLIGLNRSSACN